MLDDLGAELHPGAQGDLVALLLDNFKAHAKTELSDWLAPLVWVDGRVPAWINVNVSGLDDAHRARPHLVPADARTLGRDLPAAVDPNAPIEPFRIRGAGAPHGQSPEME